MFRYPQNIQRCETKPNNPLQPTRIGINRSEVEQIVRRSTYGIPRQSSFGPLYSTSLKQSTFLELDDEVELRIKWTTYRSETVDALMTLNGAPHFSEHYNIVEAEKQYVDDGILTTVKTTEIQKDKQPYKSKFKFKLNRIFKGCKHRLKYGLKAKSHSMSPPLLQDIDPFIIVSPSTTNFCLSTFDENSGFELSSPGGYTASLTGM